MYVFLVLCCWSFVFFIRILKRITSVRKYFILISFLNQMNQFLLSKSHIKGRVLFWLELWVTCHWPVPAALTAEETSVLTPSLDRVSSAVWRAWSPKCFRSSRKSPRAPLSKKHTQNTPRYLNIWGREFFFQISNWIFRVSVYCTRTINVTLS